MIIREVEIISRHIIFLTVLTCEYSDIVAAYLTNKMFTYRQLMIG